eukprot:3411554-Rhodomonas_salina.1
MRAVENLVSPEVNPTISKALWGCYAIALSDTWGPDENRVGIRTRVPEVFLPGYRYPGIRE